MIVVFFFALVLLVASVPFVPAFREMRLNRDAAPLTVSRRSRVDVRHFANGLRDFLVARIGYVIEDVRASHTPAEGRAEGVGSFVVVPSGAELATEDLADRIVVGAGELEIHGEGWLSREVYTKAALRLSDAVHLRAGLAEEDLELGAGSTVLRWVHAGRHLVVGEGCQLFGRASADEAIFLRAPTEFERLHAPTILVGDLRPEESGWTEPTRRMDADELAGDVDLRANRALVRGKARVPASVLLETDLVVHGDLVVGPGARVRGNLKAHGRIVVEEGAWLEGSLVATGSVELRAGAYVHGPVLSEESLRVACNVRIGDADRPTTARARHIEISDRSRFHGTLWASEAGKVVDP